MSKLYLGDGVYAQVDDQRRLVLTTENGVSITNTIYLEEEVVFSLLGLLSREKFIEAQ